MTNAWHDVGSVLSSVPSRNINGSDEIAATHQMEVKDSNCTLE
jgi:hypothetical protein